MAFDAAAAVGSFQRVYMKGGLLDYRPKNAAIQRAVKFKQDQKVGEAYVIGLAISPPQNFTYTGTTPTAQNLVSSGASSKTIQAKVLPFATHGLDTITIDTISRAETDASFESATKTVVTGLQTATANRLEMDLLLGQWANGIGVVESVTANGSNADVVITFATWAPFLWSCMGEGFMVDAWTGTTKNNSSGVLTVVQGGIDHVNRKVTFSYTGTMGSEIAVGDVLFPAGVRASGSTWNQPPGLMVQAAATSGTIIDIDRSLYSSMRGNTFDFAGPVSHGKIEDFVSALKDRGLNQDITVWLPHKAWSKLNVDQSRLRRSDSSFSEVKFKNGVKAIEYITSGQVTISLEEHGFLPMGYCVGAATNSLMRPGSADIEFGDKDSKVKFGGLFEKVPLTNYVAVPVFYDQGFANTAPFASFVGTGITYT